MKRLVILISGNGSNMMSVIKACKEGRLDAEVAGVISSSSEAGGIARAAAEGIPTFVCSLKKDSFKKSVDVLGGGVVGSFEKNVDIFGNSADCNDINLARDKQMAEIIAAIDADYIVLAGFLGILTPYFVNRFAGKIINIHPALLPKFGGKGFFGINVHKAVLESGEKVSGATVHFVDEGTDTGKIIMCREVPVFKGDTPEALQARVLEVEHSLLVDALAFLLGCGTDCASICPPSR